MGQKVYNKTVNELLLAEELVDALPGLLGPQLSDGTYGGMAYDMRVGPNRVGIRWDDATGVSEAQIDAVVAAHDPSGDSVTQEQDKRAAQVKAYVRAQVDNDPTGFVEWRELWEILRVIRGEIDQP